MPSRPDYWMAGAAAACEKQIVAVDWPSSRSLVFYQTLVCVVVHACKYQTDGGLTFRAITCHHCYLLLHLSKPLHAPSPAWHMVPCRHRSSRCAYLDYYY